MESVKTAYSKRIYDLMEAAGENQETLAAAIGATRDKVNNWINGRSRLDIENLLLLSEHYKVPVDYILGLPGAVATEDVDLQKFCKYTGLSLEAVDRLMVTNCLYRQGENESKGEYSGALSLFLEQYGDLFSIYLADFRQMTEEAAALVESESSEGVEDFLNRFEIYSFRFSKFCTKLIDNLYGVDPLIEQLEKKQWVKFEEGME